MTLTLLTERFQLAWHGEARELRYLALVADPKGLKMHETSGDAPVLLTRFTQQAVLDMTGLKGQYDVDLQWAPDSLKASPSTAFRRGIER